MVFNNSAVPVFMLQRSIFYNSPIYQLVTDASLLLTPVAKFVCYASYELKNFYSLEVDRARSYTKARPIFNFLYVSMTFLLYNA